MPRHARRFPLAWLISTLAVGACASPAERFDRHAAQLGLMREDVWGDGFHHAVFHRPKDPQTGMLHVYLGSDGTPWLRGRWPAADPTPRAPLALELMALDPAPAVYLGRPCYHGLARAPRCGDALWTDRRYGEEVAASMTAAMRRLAPDRPLVLFGYSGGGALAMLVAPRLPAAVAVVTVAANLDIDAWAEHHGYRPLVGSLNPADQPPLDPAIVQVHLAGAEDRRVPPELIRPALAQAGAPPLRVLPDHDHSRGWRRTWPAVLSALRASLAAGVGILACQPE